MRLLVDAPAFYPALLEAVRNARHHVHIEFYIFRSDRYGGELLQALTDAAGRGVQVRLLCDRLGSVSTRSSFFRAPGRRRVGSSRGFAPFTPTQNRWIFNLRNHRKIQIIDGEMAFVGGMNMGCEYMGEDPACGSWRDVQVRLRGQIATTIQRTFADDWFYATDEKLTDDVYYPVSALPARRVVQALVDGPDDAADPIQMSIVALLNAARERAWLTAGYFVPNEPLLTALKLCAQRGVDTRLLVSAKTNHPYLLQVGRSYYEESAAIRRRNLRIQQRDEPRQGRRVRWPVDDGRLGQFRHPLDAAELRVERPGGRPRLDRATRRRVAPRLRTGIRADRRSKTFRQRPYRQRCLESLFRPLAPLL